MQNQVLGRTELMSTIGCLRDVSQELRSRRSVRNPLALLDWTLAPSPSLTGASGLSGVDGIPLAVRGVGTNRIQVGPLPIDTRMVSTAHSMIVPTSGRAGARDGDRRHYGGASVAELPWPVGGLLWELRTCSSSETAGYESCRVDRSCSRLQVM